MDRDDPNFFFRKFSRRRNFRVAEKFSRRTSERTYERAIDRASKSKGGKLLWVHSFGKAKLDLWMDGLIDAWMDRQSDGWTNGRTEGQTGGCGQI